MTRVAGRVTSGDVDRIEVGVRRRSRSSTSPATLLRSCCCTRGSDRVRLWRDFPAALAEATGARVRRVLPLRPRRLGPAAAPAHAAASCTRRRSTSCPPCSRALDIDEPAPRRPQRRRVDRAASTRPTHPVRARRRDRAARVRRGDVPRRDPRGQARLRGGRAARAHGPPPSRPRRRLLRVERRLAPSRLPGLGHHRRPGSTSGARCCSSRARTTSTGRWRSSTRSRPACQGRSSACSRPARHAPHLEAPEETLTATANFVRGVGDRLPH